MYVCVCVCVCVCVYMLCICVYIHARTYIHKYIHIYQGQCFASAWCHAAQDCNAGEVSKRRMCSSHSSTPPAKFSKVRIFIHLLCKVIVENTFENSSLRP